MEALEHLKQASVLAGMSPAEIVLPESRQCLAGRMRLHYLDWGVAGRPPLLFLHGGCLTAHTWDLVCLELRGERHCLALDQRGHGDSEWSPEVDYRPAAHLGDIDGWIAHLGCERPVLVGQSMGALNALLYAREHGERLAGIVLVDISLRVGPSNVGAARIRNFTAGAAELDSLDAILEYALAFNPRRHPALLRRSLMHNLRPRPDGRLTWKYDRRFLGESVDRFQRVLDELGAAADRIRCPTLVVRGAESDVVSEPEGRELAERIPGARFAQVEGAGHTVQGDNPRGLVEALRGFLAELG